MRGSPIASSGSSVAVIFGSRAVCFCLSSPKPSLYNSSKHLLDVFLLRLWGLGRSKGRFPGDGEGREGRCESGVTEMLGHQCPAGRERSQRAFLPLAIPTRATNGEEPRGSGENGERYKSRGRGDKECFNVSIFWGKNAVSCLSS